MLRKLDADTLIRTKMSQENLDRIIEDVKSKKSGKLFDKIREKFFRKGTFVFATKNQLMFFHQQVFSQ